MLFEVKQDAAKIPGIQPKSRSDLRRRGFLPMRQFVEDADVSEGKRALQVALLQDPNLSSVEAVKAAYALGNQIGTRFGWQESIIFNVT